MPNRGILQSNILNNPWNNAVIYENNLLQYLNTNIPGMKDIVYKPICTFVIPIVENTPTKQLNIGKLIYKIILLFIRTCAKHVV